MRGVKSLIVIGAAVLMVGCQDKSAELFGRSYDECLLLNARTGGDAPSRQVAAEICTRRFQRAAVGADREISIAVDRKMEWGIRNYADGGLQDRLQIEVENNRDDRFITEVEVVADFSDKPEVNGAFPADAKVVTLTWTFPVNIAPNEQETLFGTFQNDTAPGRYAQMDAYVRKVVPFAERRVQIVWAGYPKHRIYVLELFRTALGGPARTRSGRPCPNR